MKEPWGDLRLSYYARLATLVYDLAGEEEFRRLAHEAVELYIQEKKKKGEKLDDKI